MPRRALLAPAAAFLAGIALLSGFCPAQAAGGHQLNIGVVNTTRILRRMQETKKLDADFRAKQAELAQQQQQRDAEIQDLQKHRDNNLKPGSQQYRDESAKVFQKRSELEVWKQMSSLQAEQWYKESLKGVYDHITQAAAQIAEAQHLDLVIADQSPEIGPDLEKVNVQQLQAALASRAVLYSNKRADITEDVLTQVEANYARQAPPPGPPSLPSGTTPLK
jgi:Skp family chaperone for outer membrane proteins